MDNKLDIKSSTIEKGLDIAKDFLGKLIMPSVEETGLLIKDKISHWRFKNQIKILVKAEEYCKKHNLSTKTISLKLLCPLLEYASLEEDELFQNKWSNLLINLVDSGQNIENHVFPYILSQISLEEFSFVDFLCKKKNERVAKLTNELENYLIEKPKLREQLQQRYEELTIKIIDDEQKNNGKWSDLSSKMNQEKWDLEYRIRNIDFNYKEDEINAKIEEKEVILLKDIGLKESELANLVRLGLIKVISNSYGYVEQDKIQNNKDSEYIDVSSLSVAVESDIDDYALTGLGEIFIKVCKLKECENGADD